MKTKLPSGLSGDGPKVRSMLEISALASKVGAVLATVLYCLTLLGQVDRMVIKHLEESFATKEDVENVQHDLHGLVHKMDVLLEGMATERTSGK